MAALSLIENAEKGRDAGSNKECRASTHAASLEAHIGHLVPLKLAWRGSRRGH